MESSGVKKGPWTPEEDEKLIDYISKHGHGSWRTLSKHAGLNRCGKSCRLRWTNYLRPDIKRGKVTEEEERMIVNLHSVLGNKWSKIAAHLPGRTDNEIKNFWNTHIRKKLLQMGIDPETHKPRTDFNHFINFSQLLGMSSNLPGNPLTGLQADFTTQLARLQVLQNLLQLMNSNNSFVNMGNNNPYLFGNHPSLLNPLDAFLSGTNTLQNEEPVLIRGQEYANPGLFSQAHSYSPLQDISKSWTDLEDGSNPQVLGYNNLSSNTTSHENPLPVLVATSCPRKRTFNQMDNSSSNTIFEGWEKFLDDETISGSYWKEILELTSTSESPISW